MLCFLAGGVRKPSTSLMGGGGPPKSWYLQASPQPAQPRASLKQGRDIFNAVQHGCQYSGNVARASILQTLMHQLAKASSMEFPPGFL